MVLGVNVVCLHECSCCLLCVRVHCGSNHLLLATDVHIYLESIWAIWNSGGGNTLLLVPVWLESVLTFLSEDLSLISWDVSLVVFVLLLAIMVEVLPLVAESGLLLAVSGSKWALSVLKWRDLRLERSLAFHVLHVLGFLQSLFLVFILLGDDKALLNLVGVGSI